ncbi:MAG: tetratricopeptide repeat protein [Pseudodesulfovibrio sp.]|nr:tetratricopeptide repeat protein [Pseudodesulfovibrio sp.]
MVLFLLFLLTSSGCMVSQTSVGIGTTGGMGVSFSSYGDFLYSGPGPAYSNNRLGLQKLLAKEYPSAQKVFEKTLEQYPDNPDATYYLGLTLIHQKKRKEGFAFLRKYHDPLQYRMTRAVQWWADYLEKKPELTPRKIQETMNKNRVDAYNRDSRERRGLSGEW